MRGGLIWFGFMGFWAIVALAKFGWIMAVVVGIAAVALWVTRHDTGPREASPPDFKPETPYVGHYPGYPSGQTRDPGATRY